MPFNIPAEQLRNGGPTLCTMLREIVARQTCNCRGPQGRSTQYGQPNDVGAIERQRVALATNRCVDCCATSATGRTLMRYLLPKIWFATAAVFTASAANAN